jgi:hypothetical protein
VIKKTPQPSEAGRIVNFPRAADGGCTGQCR